MIDEDLFAIINPVLKAPGTTAEAGEEFRAPPLNVLRYYRRPVKLHWFPMLGRGVSVVAVVRQPVDIEFTAVGYGRLLDRLGRAINGRFPWGRAAGFGAIVGLTTLVLTPEPIGPDDDKTLAAVIAAPGSKRVRAVPLGLVRLNLGQEALALALAQGPDGLFPEPERLADALTVRFRRFVPLIDV